MARWVMDALIPTLMNRDGVRWDEAPLPRRWHRCRPQTTGLIGSLWVSRCACGALRDDTMPRPMWLSRHMWLYRNSNREYRRRNG